MGQKVQTGPAGPPPELPKPKPEGAAALRWIIVGSVAGLVAAAVAVAELVIRSLG